jgi:hypothetical protein
VPARDQRQNAYKVRGLVALLARLLAIKTPRNRSALKGLIEEGSTEEQMTKEKSNEDDADRPTEDDIARTRLGGPKGATELKPAPMTRQRRIKMPPNDTEPGHTA